MKIILCLALVVVSQALPSAEVYPLSDEVINKINSMQSTWTAGRNFPVNTTVDQLRALAGAFLKPVQTLPTKMHDVSLEDTIPESFDAREQWLDCPSIRDIRDQASCGSCWAFAAVSAMSDRICIHSKGEKKVKVSAEDLLSCCEDGRDGCFGGLLDAAWNYWVENGIVSGGDYGGTEGCRAYSFAPCNHHIEGSEKPDCEIPFEAPACVKQCDSSKLTYKDELTFGKKGSIYLISSDEAQLKLEIMTNGPVEAAITMYSDFYTYKSGVYQPIDGFITGFHAVKLIGWGEENGTPYWLGANSFSTEWGEDGFFKINREDKRTRLFEVYAGLPEFLFIKGVGTQTSRHHIIDKGTKKSVNMKIILCLALVVATYALPSPNIYPLSDEVINRINSIQSTWTAGRNFPANTTIDQLRVLAGAFIRPVQTLPTKIHDLSLEDTIPEYFDAREQWPDCPSIRDIRDQASCGACWAFAAVSAMSDRICIHSKSEKKVKVSAEDLLSCCENCGYGCDGGYLEPAWNYWVENGIVSGGEYGDTEGCRAYSFAPCNHYVEGSEKPDCETVTETPACVKQCDSSSLSYKNELTFGKKDSVYTIISNESQIKLEIMTNGPVETSIAMYADFYAYKSGVYQPTEGIILGHHAIKIIGWGEENGNPYWLGANSFNTDWGEDGFFKMNREDKRIRLISVYAGLPEL
ncbi:uncharacterized protein LOC108907038 [Anoplophora glabripennis]|nr:uncharacterized protein LOC108907038 [Anoplophora glabripennis]